MLRTLEREWKFLVQGEVGTVVQLMRNPRIAAHVADCFGITARSVLRADEVIELAEHPRTRRKFYVVEFRLTLRPAEPFPTLVFKKYLAFSVRLVGQAVDTSSAVPPTGLSEQDGGLREAPAPRPPG